MPKNIRRVEGEVSRQETAFAWRGYGCAALMFSNTIHRVLLKELDFFAVSGLKRVLAVVVDISFGIDRNFFSILEMNVK